MLVSIQWDSVAFMAAVVPPAIGMRLATCLKSQQGSAASCRDTCPFYTEANGINTINSPSV